MKIAIFGSCVSRDTAEFMPGAEVVAYVARHSVTSLETSHGRAGVDINDLTSAFQKRMVTSDLNGTGLERITKIAKDLDVVLLDLVDERRGFWRFPDGTTMTNSLEIESCGAARAARRSGARLIEFGTDEHFDRWHSGFSTLIEGLKDAELWAKTIFLDIEWASSLDGSRFPRHNLVNQLGRNWRRLLRGSHEAGRVLSRGGSVGQMANSLLKPRPTEAESYADRARIANINYVRYRRIASGMTRKSVLRSSEQLRIDAAHKWGPQPFHYRESDYRSITAEIDRLNKAENW